MSAQDLTDLRSSVVEVCRRASAQGLVVGTAGNVSAREGRSVAVTATGADFASIDLEHVVVVDPEGRLVEGELEPTSELGAPGPAPSRGHRAARCGRAHPRTGQHGDVDGAP